MCFREDVPVLSVGLGLTVLLPSAFVSLGSAAFDMLPTASRMRIATAGAYHNILLWLLIGFLGWCVVLFRYKNSVLTKLEGRV